MKTNADSTQPFVLMIAGPNGSGKTTLTDYMRNKNISCGEYVNADDIAETLAIGTYYERTIEAQRISEQRRNYFLTNMISFSFETVMSHHSKLKLLREAKALGFFVRMFFVGIGDPAINIERVALRVAQGGHDVPKDRIVKRWHRTMNHVFEAILLCDEAIIFDNSALTGMRSVFVWNNGSGKLVNCNNDAPVPEWIYKYVIAMFPTEDQIEYTNQVQN